MLGKTAGGLFWMFRYLERCENTARLLDAGFRIALTRSKDSEKEWKSVLQTASAKNIFDATHNTYDSTNVIDFLLRDKAHGSSVASSIETARNNARLVRTALTREVWEAINECWMTLKNTLAKPVGERELPGVLSVIRQQTALVRGALHGTMLRNDIYDFARLGTFVERAESTARILDVKYYVLLPSVSLVGSHLDNVQWETILRSVSANRSYRWLNQGNINPKGIADFLILDQRMPRSLAFCYEKIADNLGYLHREYGDQFPCMKEAGLILDRIKGRNIDEIFEIGLHEFLEEFILANHALSGQIETDFRFYG